jgi:hypothetical protein
MIRQACCHRWRALLPSGTNRPMACALGRRQRLPQAQVRSGHIIEGMEKAHPLLHALAVFTEAGRLTGQRCQCLPQGQVHPFDQGRADREAPLGQAFGATHDAGAARQQLARLLLFAPRRIDQSRMLIQTHCRLSAPAGTRSPASSVARACGRLMQCHRRRVPLWVRYVAMALTLPWFIRLD